MKSKLQVGSAFGRWTVTEASPRKHYYSCKCLCGNVRDVYAYSLLKGVSISCGCHLSEFTSAKNHRHGFALPGKKRSRTYNIWANMKARCQSPKNHKFQSYGGRGITVCAKWQDFANFLADMGEAPENLSIDRIDNSLGYAPGNCRWATAVEQANNTRTNRHITIDGETKTVAQWAEVSGVKAATLRRRLRVGIDPRIAITPPFH